VLDAEGGELLDLLVGGVGGGVLEVHDVLGELTEQQHLVQRHRVGAEHPDSLVAHLPAVAERAVQHVPAPPLGQPRHVGQHVDQAGGQHHPARPHRPARSVAGDKVDGEP